ncbi:MAG: type II toxin-antitoxin system RelE/ParE family toxin [Candidatus Margulisbacteria bacterium]|jgi:plasmid stabilization system protein ParE|nr:type II toxin-antitoxin system RelE/ParE family toxin [Candidatus Margulisiibacteriota bacterium]
MPAKRLKLQILSPAQAELKEIASVYWRLAGANSARKITNKIYSALEHLLKCPALGFICRDEILQARGFRTLVCGEYLCFYRLLEDTIFIYHIVDGRTDYPRLFKEL